MKYRLRFILLILVLVNSMGYDWLHTLWHYRHGPLLYQIADTPADILTNSLDDRLVDTSQPGNTDLSPSETPDSARIYIAGLLGPDPALVEEKGTAGFCLLIFKPPKVTVIFA
jgi:hypothetical protein